MSSCLVPFDPQGAMGPAFSLIFNMKNLSTSNVSDIVTLLEINFERLANRKLEGGKEFIRSLNEIRFTKPDASFKPAALFCQRFFKNMQNTNMPAECHKKMAEVIVPEIFKEASKHFNNIDSKDVELNEWTANFLQCWYSEEKIRNYVVVDAEFLEERKRIGLGLYNAAMTEADFDRIVKMSKGVMEEIAVANDKKLTMNAVIDYLKLFAIAEDSIAASKDVLGSLPLMKAKKTFTEPK